MRIDMVIFDSLNENKLLELLADGAVGVSPTDTVYGLVCAANNQAAVQRLYRLKSRENKPGTLIASNVQQLVALGFRERYIKPVAYLWPNSLSIVIPCGPELEYLHMGKRSLAVRIPNDTAISALLEKTGPLLTSSANLPGEAPANNIEEAQRYFGDTIDFYVDGGDLAGRDSSTVIRIIDDEIEVLRQGPVTFNEKGEIV